MHHCFTIWLYSFRPAKTSPHVAGSYRSLPNISTHPCCCVWGPCGKLTALALGPSQEKLPGGIHTVQKQWSTSLSPKATPGLLGFQAARGRGWRSPLNSQPHIVPSLCISSHVQPIQPLVLNEKAFCTTDTTAAFLPLTRISCKYRIK